MSNLNWPDSIRSAVASLLNTRYRDVPWPDDDQGRIDSVDVLIRAYRHWVTKINNIHQKLHNIRKDAVEYKRGMQFDSLARSQRINDALRSRCLLLEARIRELEAKQ